MYYQINMKFIKLIISYSIFYVVLVGGFNPIETY